jgi:hypothetical protein
MGTFRLDSFRPLAGWWAARSCDIVVPIALLLRAGVTQLEEFLPSKQAVAGSSPVSRSISLTTARR